MITGTGRRPQRLASVVALFMLAGLMLVLGGCFTITQHISLKPNGSGEFALEIQMPAMMGQAMQQQDNFAENKKKMEEQGWTVTQQEAGENIIMKFSTPFSNVDDLNAKRKQNPMDSKEQGEASPMGKSDAKASISIQNLVFVKTMTYTDEYPPAGKEDMSEQDRAQARQMMEQMVKIREVLEMPGPITASNADEVKGNVATWNLNFDKIEKGFKITATTRVINYPAIAICAVIIIILIILLVVKGGKRSPEPVASKSEPMTPSAPPSPAESASSDNPPTPGA